MADSKDHLMKMHASGKSLIGRGRERSVDNKDGTVWIGTRGK